MAEGDVKTRVGLGIGVTGSGSAISAIASVYNELRRGETTVEAANKSLRDYGGSIRAQARSISLLRANYRTSNAALWESMRAMRSVARVGYTLMNIYSAYSIAQIRTADANRDVRDTEEELLRIGELRERVERDLGSQSIYALDLREQETRLTKRLADEQRGLKRAQDQNVLGYISMGLSAINVIPTLHDVWYHAKTTKEILGDASFKAMAITTIKDSAIAAKAAIVGIHTAWGSLALALATPIVGQIIFNQVGKITGEWLSDLIEEKTGVPQPELPEPGTKEFREKGLGIWPGATYFPDIGKESYGWKGWEDIPGWAGGRDNEMGGGGVREDIAWRGYGGPGSVTVNQYFGDIYDPTTPGTALREAENWGNELVNV